MQNTQSRTDTVGRNIQNATIASLHYGYETAERGDTTFHPVEVAEAVRRYTAEQLAHATVSRTAVPEVKKTGLLGAYVNGLLKFQSRDHDAVRGYAADKMTQGNNVWLCPVGAFVDDRKGGKK